MAKPLAVAPIKLVARVPDEPGEYVADRKMTFEEYLELDHERGLAEWIDGDVHFYVGATGKHQIVRDFIVALFNGVFRSIGGGRAVSSGFVVRALPTGNGREPDVVVFTSRNRDRFKRTFFDGPPDIIVEVVSDESVERDYVTKRREYERAGVAEYWIIDPRPGHEDALFLVLRDGVYAEVPAGDGIYRSVAVPEFWLRVEWLWDDEPDLLPRLLEILGR